MTFRLFLLSAIICLSSLAGFGQVNSLIGQVTDSAAESFAGGISADGRFIVFESRGDIATENPRNADGNREIFLFDYAQRRIFQITDTKCVLFDPSVTPYVFSNIRVEIANIRPVISADGKWIAFSSNATSATPAAPNTTNPGAFDGNALTAPTPVPSPSVTPSPNPTATPVSTPVPSPTATPTPPANPLTADGNMEMWLYQVPAFAPVADLSQGDEQPLTNLAGGTFTRVTNTDPSQLPRAATTTQGAFVASDNHDASISDDGSVIAFVSNRDLVIGGNPGPPQSLTEDNDEIFTYVRAASAVNQITKTPRGPVSNPIYNKNPTISGNGIRICFSSTGDDPIFNGTTNLDTGSNPSTSRNEEVFYADLTPSGSAVGGKQITTTTPTNPGDIVNILDLGRRMSKDGRYIAFDSYADLANEQAGANYTSFGLYVYDTTAATSPFRRIGPRSTADTVVTSGGGDVDRYPGFTDNDAAGTPSTLVFETRNNIKADGTIPATAADGLNPDSNRPPQIYSYSLSAATPTFTRLALFPTPTSFLSTTQLITSNSLSRMAFNLGATDLGTGNFDGQSEVYYFLRPRQTATMRFGPIFYTGATRQRINITPAPSPTVTPTPTPTPTATPTPSPSVSPTPTPTPVTPDTVYGMAPGMLAQMDFGRSRTAIVPRTASTVPARAPGLPWELSGVTFGINGLAAGLKSVDASHLEFVTPRSIPSASAGTSYQAVLNLNGSVSTQRVVIVPTRPDIFNSTMTPAPGGRSKIFNVTNRVYTTEPFVVRTIRRQGNALVPSVLRIYLTGTVNIGATLITVRIRDKTMTGIAGTNLFVEPGVETIDFPLSSDLEGAGDQPVVVTVTINGITFSSRLDDTTSRISIL